MKLKLAVCRENVCESVLFRYDLVYCLFIVDLT